MIKDLLLPRKKYAEEMKKHGRRPFTFEVEKNGQVLYYFAANHSPDPKNEQYPKLRKYWKKFLKITKNKDKIVLIEGGLRPLHKNEKIAITKSSEGGLVTFLAQKEEILVVSPDQNDRFVKKFSKDTALLYWFLTWFDGYQRIPEPRPNFNNWMRKLCARWKKTKEWKGIEISVKRIKSLYKEIIGKKFDPNESQNHLVNPNNTGTKINEFARAKSDIRDTKIVSEIEKYWKEGKSMFVVFGSGHLIIQRPALEKLLI